MKHFLFNIDRKDGPYRIFFWPAVMDLRDKDWKCYLPLVETLNASDMSAEARTAAMLCDGSARARPALRLTLYWLLWSLGG